MSTAKKQYTVMLTPAEWEYLGELARQHGRSRPGQLSAILQEIRTAESDIKCLRETALASLAREVAGLATDVARSSVTAPPAPPRGLPERPASGSTHDIEDFVRQTAYEREREERSKRWERHPAAGSFPLSRREEFDPPHEGNNYSWPMTSNERGMLFAEAARRQAAGDGPADEAELYRELRREVMEGRAIWWKADGWGE
jgi:hypothetical protein